MEISMNEILKNFKYRSPTSDGIYLAVRGGTGKAKNKREYLNFVMGEDIIAQMNLREKDYLNFVWDPDKRTGFLEAATATTGRIVYAQTKKARKLVVAYPMVGNYRLPYSKEKYELSDIKVKRGKVSFTYTGKLQDDAI